MGSLEIPTTPKVWEEKEEIGKIFERKLRKKYKKTAVS